jgi:predicted HD phosphohydrolase
MSSSPAEVAADQLLAWYVDAGDRGYIGEPVSQLEHALQCAAFADAAGAPDAIALGALFHDVGHLSGAGGPAMADLGVLHHERVGAALLLAAGCSQDVADVVAGHVDAKRYLCSGAASTYYERLSEASKGTLAFQGGPMSAAEATAFEQHPNFKWILAVRAWDEAAKDPAAVVPPLGSYRPRLVAHIEAAAAATASPSVSSTA